MRLILKVLLFPVVMVLTILVAICRFLCTFSTVLLSIIALILFALALATMIFLHDMSNGPKMLVLAWLISPFGIPLFASWLVDIVDYLNCKLKAV